MTAGPACSSCIHRCLPTWKRFDARLDFLEHVVVADDAADGQLSLARMMSDASGVT